MEKIETIRKACIKANPSIKDLVFGCEVMMKWGDYHGDVATVEYVCGKCKKHKLSKNCNEDCYFDGNIEDAISVVHSPEDEPKEWILLEADYDIIGRPIRLADVLLAIKDNTIGIHKSAMNNGTYAWFIKLHEPNGLQFKATGKLWHLLKDDLTQQSDETIDFLYELLK